jgi:hypothetical protein
MGDEVQEDIEEEDKLSKNTGGKSSLAVSKGNS